MKYSYLGLCWTNYDCNLGFQKCRRLPIVTHRSAWSRQLPAQKLRLKLMVWKILLAGIYLTFQLLCSNCRVRHCRVYCACSPGIDIYKACLSDHIKIRFLLTLDLVEYHCVCFTFFLSEIKKIISTQTLNFFHVFFWCVKLLKMQEFDFCKFFE